MRSSWQPNDEQLAAAARDLAEFGWVTVPTRLLAQRIYRLAVAAGQPARIVPGNRGWWRVEIVDMRPRGDAREMAEVRAWEPWPFDRKRSDPQVHRRRQLRAIRSQIDRAQTVEDLREALLELVDLLEEVEPHGR